MTVMDIRVGGAEKLGFMARTAATLLQWRDSRVIREQLSRLSDRELDDIGLSRGDIRRVSRTR